MSLIVYNGKYVTSGGKLASTSAILSAYNIFAATSPQIIYKSTNEGVSFVNDGSKGGPYPIGSWYMPSEDELNAIYTNLYLEGVVDFMGVSWWSSTEVDASTARMQDFSSGVKSTAIKTDQFPTVAVRTFNDTPGAYNLKDGGPAGGFIFYVDGSTYYETGPKFYSWTGVAGTWCPSTNIVVGATATAIGSGQNNTDLIVNIFPTGGMAQWIATDWEVTFGNPTSLCKLLNGDIVYVTSNGWFVNHTKGWAVGILPGYSVDSIIESEGYLYASSASYADALYSPDGGWTWNYYWD